MNKIKDYRYFYLSMFGGIVFIAGIFYAMEFKMFTLKWFCSVIFTIFPTVLYFIFVREVYKNKGENENKK